MTCWNEARRVGIRREKKTRRESARKATEDNKNNKDVCSKKQICWLTQFQLRAFWQVFNEIILTYFCIKGNKIHIGVPINQLKN